MISCTQKIDRLFKFPITDTGKDLIYNNLIVKCVVPQQIYLIILSIAMLSSSLLEKWSLVCPFDDV
jgi:hypothetical protein